MREAPDSVVPFPAARARRTRIAGAALLGASLLALGATLPGAPVVAQRAPEGATVMTPMGRAPLSFADIVDRVKPAVVSISVSSGGRTAQRPNERGQGPQGRAQPPRIPGLPEEWNEFFRNMPRDGGTPRPVQAQGSGFVISEDGYVVTNNHVIDRANKIEVVFDNPEGGEGNKFEAELVGTDPRTDIALLRIKNPGNRKFHFVRFAQEAKPPRVGDWVIAVGNPFGLGGTVTVGIVSALARTGISEGPYDYLQIDAAVNRGNSGGPTFNLDGEVVGVNTAIYSPSGGNVGIAFAVPATTVTKVIEQLRKTGTVARGWLGVKIQNLDAEMAKSFGLADTQGALVQEVTARGPAEASGIRVEDVILSVNGTRIKDTRDLALKIAEFAPNTVVDVRVMRRDREETIKVKLGLFPGAAEVAATDRNDPSGATRQLSSLGLTFSTGGPRRGLNQRDRTEGVTITAVEEGSDAANKGINTGDVVTHVNGEAVGTADEIDAAVKRGSSRGSVRLTIRSENRTAVVALTLKRG